MPKALELTWVASLKQWRKQRTVNGYVAGMILPASTALLAIATHLAGASARAQEWIGDSYQDFADGKLDAAPGSPRARVRLSGRKQKSLDEP